MILLSSTEPSQYFFMLQGIELGPQRQQTAGAKAITVAGGDIIQLFRTQHHRLALAQQNRAGLALKSLAATLTVFGFVFGFHLLLTKIYFLLCVTVSLSIPQLLVSTSSMTITVVAGFSPSTLTNKSITPSINSVFFSGIAPLFVIFIFTYSTIIIYTVY